MKAIKKIFSTSSLSSNKFVIKSNCKTFLYTIASEVKEDTNLANSTNLIKVYSAPEIEDLQIILEKSRKLTTIEAHRNLWKSFINENSSFKPKYFALLPMFFENKITKCRLRFIVEMSLLPEKKMLKFTSVEASGLVEYYEVLQDIIPITPEDYVLQKKLSRASLPDFVDGDMLYMNRKTVTNICFDKQGTWHKEGISNELFSLDKSFSEKKWFDTVYWDHKWIQVVKLICFNGYSF